jgi:HK97 family phage portal protein
MALITLNLSQPVELRNNPLENPSVALGNLSAIWSWISGTEPTASGEIIDNNTALQIITVYSCVRLIAETVASLPLKLYKRLPKGRDEAVDNPLYDLLAVAPNPEMGAVPFWETVVGGLALTGNSYVYVQKVNGIIVALWPLHPNKTVPIRLPNGDLAYKTTDGLSNGLSRIYQATEILHFKLFSLDGLLGLSPVMLARQSLGLTRAAEKMGSRLFANGGRPSGVMSTEMQLDEKTLINIRESWQAAQTGDNALKTAFVPGGWKYTPIGLDLEAIEFLKTRNYQRSEIAALFRISPHMIGDTSRMSNSNSEQEGLNLVTFTLRPYLTRIENEIQRVLLPSVGRNAGKMFVEFDVRGLLRGNFKETMEGYSIGRQWGFLNANTILDELGENPIGPIGDIYWCPVNMQNAERLLDPPEPTIEPEPSPTADKPSVEAPKAIEAPSTEPTADERSIVKRASSLMVVFRDGVGRLLHRQDRSLATITGIFEPCLRSITALSIDHASHQIGATWADEGATEKIISDAMKALEHRAERWTAETADEVAQVEFRKVLRTIVSCVYRELGANTVLEDK